MIPPFAHGGAQRLRGLLRLLKGNFRAADAVGTVHDMRFVFLDNDTKFLFATAYDGEWDPYIEDFATKIPDAMDVLFSAFEGWPGIRSPKVKDWIVEHQIAAEAGTSLPDLTVAETRRLESVGKAVEEFLDKIGRLRCARRKHRFYKSVATSSAPPQQPPQSRYPQRLALPTQPRRKADEQQHLHHQGRHADLLQGLGRRTADRVSPRLAALCRTTGTRRCCSSSRRATASSRTTGAATGAPRRLRPATRWIPTPTTSRSSRRISICATLSMSAIRPAAAKSRATSRGTARDASRRRS